MGELSFKMADIYGQNFGFNTTRAETLPEEEDQNALVDDQALAKKNPVHHDPKISRNILIGMGVIGAIIILFSIN